MAGSHCHEREGGKAGGQEGREIDRFTRENDGWYRWREAIYTVPKAVIHKFLVFPRIDFGVFLFPYFLGPLLRPVEVQIKRRNSTSSFADQIQQAN
jgi:hypothetical protein